MRLKLSKQAMGYIYKLSYLYFVADSFSTPKI